MSHATWVEPDTNSKRMYCNLQKTHESLKPSFRFNAIENPYIAWQTAAAPIGRRTICTSPAPGNYKAAMRVAKLSIQSIANLHLLSLQLEQLEYLSTTPLSRIRCSHQVAVAKTDLTWTMIKLSARMWVKRHRTETEALYQRILVRCGGEKKHWHLWTDILGSVVFSIWPLCTLHSSGTVPSVRHDLKATMTGSACAAWAMLAASGWETDQIRQELLQIVCWRFFGSRSHQLFAVWNLAFIMSVDKTNPQWCHWVPGCWFPQSCTAGLVSVIKGRANQTRILIISQYLEAVLIKLSLWPRFDWVATAGSWKLQQRVKASASIFLFHRLGCDCCPVWWRPSLSILEDMAWRTDFLPGLINN